MSVVPVDADDHGVQSKGGVVDVVLTPDLAAMVVAFMGRFERIVDACYDEHQPGDGCNNSQEDQLTTRVRPLRVVRVDCGGRSATRRTVNTGFGDGMYEHCHALQHVVGLHWTS